LKLERIAIRAERMLVYLNERLGGVERWLLISGLTSIVASLSIGLFYVLRRIAIVASAFIHGVPDPLSYIRVSDYAVLAIESNNIPAIFATIGLFSLAASIIVYTFAPEAAGGGTDAIVDAYHHEAGLVRPRVAIVKAVSSALLLGSGGSAGPAVQIGGASGSFVARVLRLSVEERKISVVAGIAAALSFIFQSPVGSALFAVEVLYEDDMEVDALVPSLLSSVIAYSLSLHILGPGQKLPSIQIPDLLTMYGFDALASYILLGIYSAVFGYLYIVFFNKSKEFFRKLHEEKGIDKRLNPVIGALLSAVIAVFLPQILGTSEEVLAESLRAFQHGGMVPGRLVVENIFIGLLALAVAKLLATSLVVGSGGSGGLLAPGLFAGAMSGQLFGLLIYPYVHVPPAIYAYLGMAAVFGGASKVPLGMSFLVAEIGGTPALIVPAMVASLTSAIVLRGVTIVEAQLPHRVSPQLFTAESLLAFVRENRLCIRVEEVAYAAPVVVRWDEPLSQAAHRLLSSRQRVAVVVDEEGRVVGVLDPGYAGLDLRYALRSNEPVAAAIVASAPIVRKGECISRALEQMLIYGSDYVIVTDNARRPVGIITLDDIASVLLPHMLRSLRSARAKALGKAPSAQG
jgi:CIC family chloride channel protein